MCSLIVDKNYINNREHKPENGVLSIDISKINSIRFKTSEERLYLRIKNIKLPVEAKKILIQCDRMVPNKLVDHMLSRVIYNGLTENIGSQDLEFEIEVHTLTFDISLQICKYSLDNLFPIDLSNVDYYMEIEIVKK